MAQTLLRKYRIKANFDRKTIVEQRKKIAELELRIATLAGALNYERTFVEKQVERQAKIREQQNVTNLTNGLAAFISTITNRRVKNLNWSWE